MRCAFLVAALVLAAPQAAAVERVVVVEVPSEAGFAWPSGERAVVAELMAGDVELVLRPSRAGTIEALEREVLDAARAPDTAGAVGVGREGSFGFALVALPDDRALVRIEDDTGQGPVADGAVALRVSELLHVRSFDLPPEKKPRPRAPPPPPPPEEPKAAPLWPWLALGGLATRDASNVAPVVALGLRVPLHDWISVEPSGALTLTGLSVRTRAGSVSLSAKQATLQLVVATTAPRGLSAGMGAGGGIAWISAAPSANAGYLGTERSTEVSLFALRGFGGWQATHLKLLAFVEASALLPVVTVRAGGSEVARLGQPWLLGGVALGYSP